MDAIIGLPANIFFGTAIPTCILVFKKCREANDNILFIDASNDYEKGKNQNLLRDEDVEKLRMLILNEKQLISIRMLQLLRKSKQMTII